MLQIDLINTDKKMVGGVMAIVDFLNPEEVRTVIKSILDLHRSVMATAKKSDKAIKDEEVIPMEVE